MTEGQARSPAFFVVDEQKDKVQEQSVKLVRDDWDDYGFKTMFRAFYVDSRGEEAEIGVLKIAAISASSPYRVDLPSTFDELPGFYVSLGAPGFYENLAKALGDRRLVFDILRRIRDIHVAVNADDLRDAPVVKVSLARGSDDSIWAARQAEYLEHGGPDTASIVDWFHENYEDPVELLPYDTLEGGFQWFAGGPWDARDEISDQYGGLARQDFVEAAIEELENQGSDWVKRSEYDLDQSVDSPSLAAGGPIESLAEVVDLKRERSPGVEGIRELSRRAEAVLEQAVRTLHDGAWADQPGIELDVESAVQSLRAELYPPIERAPSSAVLEGLALRLDRYIVETLVDEADTSQIATAIEREVLTPLERAEETKSADGVTEIGDWIADNIDWDELDPPPWLGNDDEWKRFVESAQVDPVLTAGVLLGWVGSIRIENALAELNAAAATTGSLASIGGGVGFLVHGLAGTGLGTAVGVVIGSLIALLRILNRPRDPDAMNAED